jgi:U3 small nucleolar RNA-associated protein 12
MSHDVLTVRYSQTKSSAKLMVAIGLLDNTVKVFYDDSLKFFLSLYGHKLPVMCLDVSYDNTILVSGSADKTVKIWGLDFGDCHRSLIAHEDSVTCIRFQPFTHYFFTSGTVPYTMHHTITHEDEPSFTPPLTYTLPYRHITILIGTIQ